MWLYNFIHLCCLYFCISAQQLGILICSCKLSSQICPLPLADLKNLMSFDSTWKESFKKRRELRGSVRIGLCRFLGYACTRRPCEESLTHRLWWSMSDWHQYTSICAGFTSELRRSGSHQDKRHFVLWHQTPDEMIRWTFPCCPVTEKRLQNVSIHYRLWMLSLH